MNGVKEIEKKLQEFLSSYGDVIDVSDFQIDGSEEQGQYDMYFSTDDRLDGFNEDFCHKEDAVYDKLWETLGKKHDLHIEDADAFPDGSRSWILYYYPEDPEDYEV